MALYTKSIQAKPNKKDGIRICIMRRPDSNANFDVWMPVVAPSNKLLTDYHAKKFDWDGMEKRFINTVIMKKKKYLKLIAEIALTHDITLLCWEETPKCCHRRLVAEECKRIEPNLTVIIK